MSFDIIPNYTEEFIQEFPDSKEQVNRAISKWKSIITDDLPNVENVEVAGFGNVYVVQ